MKQLALSQTSNRRALLAFIAVLSAVVITAAFTVLLLQQRHLLDKEKEELRVEMTLLGELATDSLLRSDYASVEGLIRRWVNKHSHIAEIRAVMPNGFALAEIRKSIPASHPIRISQPVSLNDRLLLTLHVTSDFSYKQTGFTTIIINTTLVSVLLILLLGWLLWDTLKRTALVPLRTEIIRREKNEHELQQRTAELEAALKELEIMHKELESFSYSVSHDLRAPLRAIDGFSRVILEDFGPQLDPAARGYLTRITAAVERMGGLIDDLLALSRVSRRELVMTDINLSDMAARIMAELQEQSPSRQVSVRIAPGLSTRGDAPLLHIMLGNLLGNAWKYTGKTSPAHIEFSGVREDGGVLWFCVRDNGAGFDMQFSDKLFQPFQRLHSAGEFPGSGIGLATVARIIHRHHGRIRAEGQTGLGATFCFTLAGDALHSGPAPDPSKPERDQL
ncbi:MAG: hypothetical protein QG652_470 [Pseudomonadota bacterium]|nr:hypothetical protein [Pseudomonadota bacterium]